METIDLNGVKIQTKKIFKNIFVIKIFKSIKTEGRRNFSTHMDRQGKLILRKRKIRNEYEN